MAWQDRPYAHEYDDDGPRRHYHGSGLSGLSVSTLLIIANAVIFFLMFGTPLGAKIADLGVMRTTSVLHGQLWRLLTATYLHANLPHLLFNMLGLYFFGPALERVWGPRQFLFVYTLAGVFANVIFTLAGVLHFLDPRMPGLGASGSVVAMLGAAAVLFPNAQVYIYFLFPIRIRTFVLLYGAWFVYNVFQKGANYGGDLCHLAGLLVGLWWAYSGGFSLTGRHKAYAHPSSLLSRLGLTRKHRPPPSRGLPFDRYDSTAARRRDDAELDRILTKVHAGGIDSLTPAERDVLIAESERRRAADRGDPRADDER